MAISKVALFGAAFSTPAVADKITHSIWWQWTFHLLAILLRRSAASEHIFLVPETAYRCPDELDIDFDTLLGNSRIMFLRSRTWRELLVFQPKKPIQLKYWQKLPT